MKNNGGKLSPLVFHRVQRKSPRNSEWKKNGGKLSPLVSRDLVYHEITHNASFKIAATHAQSTHPRWRRPYNSGSANAQFTTSGRARAAVTWLLTSLSGWRHFRSRGLWRHFRVHHMCPPQIRGDNHILYYSRSTDTLLLIRYLFITYSSFIRFPLKIQSMLQNNSLCCLY